MENKRAATQKYMKQTTLFDYGSSPMKAPPKPWGISSKPSKRTQEDPAAPNTPVLKIKKPRKKKRKYSSDESGSESSNSDNIRRIKLESKEPIEISSSSSDSHSGSGESEDEVDAPPITTPAKRFEKLRAYVDSEDKEDEEDSPQPTRRRLKKGRPRSSEDIEDEETGHKRRRLTRERKTGVKGEEDNDTEDVDDLDPERVLETRLRERGKKTAFQKNLEKLKRRKAKKPMSSASSEDEEEEEALPPKPFKGAKRTDDFFGDEDQEEGSGSDSSGFESDFIVEDGPLGAPILPAAFSMETHQDLSHQFKKIFQFFVHIAVQPPENRKAFMQKNMEDEEYFSVPLVVTRRKLSGLRDSLVASSVWRPEFKRALEKFPQFELTELPFAVPECDACHLGRRMSKWTGRLSGEPYDRMGFQIKQQTHRKSRDTPSEDSDSGSDTDSSSSHYDESEEEPLKLEFNLGRFCAKRTRVYHGFCHWENDLFCAIDREIQELRQAKTKGKKQQFYKIAWAGGKKPPDDLTDADEICEWLDDRQVIEMEWKKVKLMMDSARNLEMDAKRGDDD